MTDYFHILEDYISNYASGAMLQEDWAFKPAKSYGWKAAARGADFHVDQPLRTHILNGLFALTRLLEYLDERGYFTLSEQDFKRTLVLHTLHDAYKDPVLTRTRLGGSDFGVPLDELDVLYQRMELHRFVALTPADLRAASVSLLSNKVGDIAAGTSGITHLFTLVHLADSLASQQTARDYRSAENRLREISMGDAVMARNDARIRRRLSLGDEVPPVNSLPELAFYYHELDDYRGLSTLLIHQVTEDLLRPAGLYPLLYFANGILYVGPKGVELDPEELHHEIARQLFSKIREEWRNDSLTVAKMACSYDKGITQFKEYAYIFCSFQTLLLAASEKIIPPKNVKGFLRRILAKRVERRKYQSPEEFFQRYHISAEVDNEESRARRLFAAAQMVMATESLARFILPEANLAWLCTLFRTPVEVAAIMQQHQKMLRDGGIADHCLIIAYHWLLQERFFTDRSWLEVEVADIKQAGVEVALQSLSTYEQEDAILAQVEKALGIQSDVLNYLQSTLSFSFAPARSEGQDALIEYEKARGYSHHRLCVLCNRLISTNISKKQSEMDTSVAEQAAQIFSNRRVPNIENKGNMMVWCPMCYLEFMLRKLSGQGYPEGGDYNNSYRLHLYILPDYSFTPELWTLNGQELLGAFHAEQTMVTRLALRGSKEEPALPRRWLEHGAVDEEWLTGVQELFGEQAEHMQTRGKGVGDRLIFSLRHPNYMLFTYDNVVFENMDNKLKTQMKPTRTEIWAKALYAAVLIQLLTGARVYITDKPYLTFTRPEEMKTIIEMEGLPALFTGLFPISHEATNGARASESSARLPLGTLSTMLDLLAAIWEINATLNPQKPGKLRRNLDKQIASVLQEINANYLVGAAFYRRCERNGLLFYPSFLRACQMLLPQTNANDQRRALHEAGYTLMLDKEGEAWMNLAQEITEVSWQLFRPRQWPEKGRAHRYETLFRTGVEALKGGNTRAMSDEERVARVAGILLKRLERLLDDRKQGYPGPLYGAQRTEGVQKLAELLVIDLFHNACKQSIAKLTHEENPLASTIYFLTQKKWDHHQAEKHRTPQDGEEPDVLAQDL